MDHKPRTERGSVRLGSGVERRIFIGFLGAIFNTEPKIALKYSVLWTDFFGLIGSVNRFISVGPKIETSKIKLF